MGDDYSYGDYLQSGEVSPPPEIAPVAETPASEYTGSEYELLGNDTGESESCAQKMSGVDLNDGVDDNANDGAASKEAAADEVGEDLNDTDQLDAVLDNFQEDHWNDLSQEGQKQSITELAGHVADMTDNKNPPEIVFRNDMEDGSYGYYSPGENMLVINENMLGDSAEAADTVAHEMWHAYQHQCALDPANERGQEYQDGFDNYINPEYDFEGYQNQMVEAEAREFAQGFKDRLSGKKGTV